MRFSIVNYSEVVSAADFRLDAEYYRQSLTDLEGKIKAKNWDYLGKQCPKIINFGAYSLCNLIEFIDEGVPYLNVGNVKEGIINYDEAPQIDSEFSKSVLWKSMVTDGQVLLTMAGTIGNAAVAYNVVDGCNSNQAIANIHVPESISPYYLAVYLNSKYGRGQTERLKMSSVQPNLLLGQVKNIKVYLPNFEFAQIVSNLYKESLNTLENAKIQYSEADNLLLDELSLSDWRPRHKLAFVADYADVKQAERIDADYFQPKYAEIVSLIEGYPNKFCELSEAEIKDVNFTPESETEYKYIELADIGANGEITGCTLDVGKDLPTRARRKVATSDVIVSSIEGSLSSIALIGKEYDNALCSTGFYVINSKEVNSETLLVFLKSIAGQLQLKRGCSGTILTAIGKDEFSRILLPKIDAKIQTEIQRKVRESFELRAQSKRLLENAKRAVEVAIETDEQTALDWLNRQD